MTPSAGGRRCQHRLATLLNLLFVIILAAPATCAGDEEPLLAVEQVRVGFDGHFKVGRWTPISVTIRSARAGSVNWSIEVPDPHGNPTVLAGPTAEFEAPGEKTLAALFRTGRLESNLRIRAECGAAKAEVVFRSDASEESPWRPALEQSVVLVAVLGEPAGLSDLQELERPVRIVHVQDAAALPGETAGYDGLDLLFINGNPQINRRQSDAIRDWVHAGGRLALAVGRHTPDLQNSPLYDWIGARIPLKGTRSLRELRGLESFIGEESPIPISRRQPVMSARVEVGTDDTGEPAFNGNVLITEQREPLVVRSACGFGIITLLAFDIDRPPLSEWDSLPQVVRKVVFDEYPSLSEQSRKRSRRLSKTGVSDLATQLFSALDEFAGAASVSTWLVMTLLAVYLVIIGPADYFLVHRVWKNPRMTWVSFPLIVCISGALAIWTARETHSGEVQLNQIDLVDIDAGGGDSQFVRSRSWMSVFTPETMRNQVSSQPLPLRSGNASEGTSSSQSSYLLSWTGVPESGFGGMYRTGGIEFGRPRYHYAATGSGIEDLPVTRWSTTSLASTGVEHSPPLVESDLSSRGYGLISGTLTHYLDAPLYDWMLAYGPGVYVSTSDKRTGERTSIEPGVAWSPDPNLPTISQQELLGYLTRTRLKEVERSSSNTTGKTEYRLAQSEYDPFSREPGGILRMISFYRRVGGEKYTRLSNDALRDLDCTALLDLNCAILFARIDLPASELTWNGGRLESSKRSTFVRIVLPVRQVR